MEPGSPDLENGWFKLADAWAEAFSAAPLTALEHRVVWWVLRNTYANKDGAKPDARKTFVPISVNAIASAVRSDWRHTRNAIARLVSAGVLFQNGTLGLGGDIGLGKSVRSWKVWGRKAGPEFVPGVRAWEPGDVPEPDPSDFPLQGAAAESPAAEDPGESPVAPPQPSALDSSARPSCFPASADTDWWFVPGAPLPEWRDVLELGQKARTLIASKPVSDPAWREWFNETVGYPIDRTKPRRWAVMLDAIEDCVANFHGPRHQGGELPEQGAAFWALLPKVRAAVCVVSDKADKPPTLLKALARLRILVAICDPEDENDGFWVRKVAGVKNLERHLPKMLLQAAGTEWLDREDRLAAKWGGA